MIGIKVQKAQYKELKKVVYDIEVKDNHNFYASTFLVHNCTVFAAKKKYFARVRDSEGTRYPINDPKIKVMGLEISKSSTPKWSKKKLKEAVPLILDKDENELKNWIKDIKNEFCSLDLNEIAAVGSVSNLQYNLGVDKGIPIGSRAALVHNKYIKDNNLENKYVPIMPGDKCKKLFLTEPNKFNSNIVAYTNEQFIQELDCIDYDMNFEKGFISALSLMVNALSYNLNKQTTVLNDW